MMTSPASSSPSVDMKLLTQPVAMVEDYLNRCLDQRPLPPNLDAAIRYALLGGGKRMRPILVVRSCEAVGGAAEAALPAAAAIEMIHAFSLVHDDLPAMDDDDLRRGRPTLHIHAGEAMAILAGDAMMSLPFEFVADRIGETAKDPQTAWAVMRELARGTTDMIAGQVYDTLGGFPDGATERQRLELIHRNKTAALLRTSCRMGGLCGKASAQQMDALTRYAEAIGLMFQIVDDILDVTRTSEEIGKRTHKDAEAGKLTYPGVMGLEASQKEVVRLQKEAHAALDVLGDRSIRLRELCDYMAVRQK